MKFDPGVEILRGIKVCLLRSDVIDFKVCGLCHLPKELSHFYKDRGRGDGYGSRCKICLSEYNKTPSRVEVNRRYREKHAYTNEKYLKNKEKTDEHRRRYYTKNREIILAKQRAKAREAKSESMGVREKLRAECRRGKEMSTGRVVPWQERLKKRGKRTFLA